MHRNIYITHAQNLLYVSALHRCHHQGVFTVVKVVLSKWSAVWHHSHTLSHLLNCDYRTGETTHKITLNEKIK